MTKKSLSSPDTHYLGWKSSMTGGDGRLHNQSSLSGLRSLSKDGHCASEGALGRQVTTTGPCGSLETGNSATRRETLQEVTCIR